MPDELATLLSEIRQRLPLAEYLASKGFVLRQSGRDRLVALCPFHADRRRPNMVVFTDDHRFHCYACGARGDIFDMAMRLDGHPTFASALRALALRAGLPSPPTRPQNPDDRAGVLALATKLYAQHLDANVLAYLERRSFPESFVRKWRIGYAPPKASRLLRDFLRQHSVAEKAALACGALAEVNAEGGRFVRDFFSIAGGGYITFPNPGWGGSILDLQGRAFPEIAFKPKYLNLPKSRRHLFNESILPRAFVILTEGIPDALSCLMVDQPAVAMFGASSFPERFVNQFARCGPIYVALDRDAYPRSVEVAIQFGLHGRVVRLPTSLGPHGDLNDFLVQLGPARFRNELVRLLQAADTGYAAALDDLPADLQLFDLFQTATPLLAALGAVDPISRDAHLMRVSAKYGIAMETLREATKEALLAMPSPASHMRQNGRIQRSVCPNKADEH